MLYVLAERKKGLPRARARRTHPSLWNVPECERRTQGDGGPRAKSSLNQPPFCAIKTFLCASKSASPWCFETPPGAPRCPLPWPPEQGLSRHYFLCEVAALTLPSPCTCLLPAPPAECEVPCSPLATWPRCQEQGLSAEARELAAGKTRPGGPGSTFPSALSLSKAWPSHLLFQVL